MAEGEEPGDYIDQRQDLHDCFFLVGTEKKERISTVKYFLANYSSYFRAMLLETDMKEKNSKEDIEIPDHEPDVFRLMLSFVYGRHDIKFKNVNQAMRFHILVDRCLMPKLKKISTKYVVENCKSNLCEVLECAVLLEIKEMEPRAKTIVEKDTRALLSSPDFLNANPAIVEFIVKQEGLNVTEVELWRALVYWAKRQCENKSEGNILRKKVGGFIQHIRFLKMSLKEFAEEVVPTSILTPTEIITVFVDMASGKGNAITEAASRTRREWSSPIPTTCVVSLQFGDRYLYGYRQTWECEYEIKNITPTQMRISSIELMDISSWVHIKLMNINENRLVASKSFGKTNDMIVIPLHDRSPGFPLMSQPGSGIPTIFELPDNWLVEASKSYRLCIETTNYNSFSNNINYRNPSFVKEKSCEFCTLQFIYSSVNSSIMGGQGGASFVKSLKFSVVSN